MTDVQSIQFLLKKKIAEEKIVATLNSFLGFFVDTADFNVPGAVGVVQILLHSEGFGQSCLVSWPKKHSPQLSEEDMAKSIATALDVDVLLEMDDDEWLLAQPGKEPRIVEVIELEDGLDVKPD